MTGGKLLIGSGPGVVRGRRFAAAQRLAADATRFFVDEQRVLARVAARAIRRWSVASLTRQRLIDTALELFHCNGFRDVGLDRILSEVGVTKTTFYKYFESKDDLVIQVLRERDSVESREWLEKVAQMAGDDPRGQIMAFFDLLEEWFERPDFRGCLFMNAAAEYPMPTDPVHRAAAEHGDTMYREVRALASAAGAEDPDVLTKQLMLLIVGAIISRHAVNAQDSAVTARQMAELLLEAHLPAGVPMGAGAV